MSDVCGWQMQVRFTVLCFFVLMNYFFSSTLNAKDSKLVFVDDNVFNFYCAGWSSYFQRFQKDVIDAILLATEEEYGEFSLQYIDTVLSDKRITTELKLGRQVHFDFYTSFNGRERNTEDSVNIHFPLFNGLLGLRRVVVRRSEHSLVSRLSSVAQFKTMQFGQVRQWPDVKIYQYAGLHVVNADRYVNLYPMLAKGRFNFLPLSILEIDTELEKQQSFYDELMVHEQIYIFYPLPVYLSVTKALPELMERLRFGIKKVIESGDFQTIFHKYFQQHIENIAPEYAKVFILNNPVLSEEENILLAKDTLDMYFNPYARIYWLY